MAYREIEIFKEHGVRAFIGGCFLRGEGSKFRAKAHAHYKERIVCFRSDKWLWCVPLLIHELAHILSPGGHIDSWREKVKQLGGTIEAIPGISKSYVKKERPQKPKCGSCGSGQVYLRLQTKEFVCRQCGSVTKQEPKKEKTHHGN